MSIYSIHDHQGVNDTCYGRGGCPAGSEPQHEDLFGTQSTDNNPLASLLAVRGQDAGIRGVFQSVSSYLRIISDTCIDFIPQHPGNDGSTDSGPA